MTTPKPETILRIGLEYTEIGNAEIRELFGRISSSTIVRLKNEARKLQTESDVLTWYPNHVNTKLAFKAWGLDVEDAERRYKKLKALGLARAALN
jgi:hypothetical protein